MTPISPEAGDLGSYLAADCVFLGEDTQTIVLSGTVCGLLQMLRTGQQGPVQHKTPHFRNK